MTPTYRPRAEQLSWREVDGELVLLDETDWSYLHLNETGAVIWKTLETGADETQLVDGLTAEFDVDRDTAAADVSTLLAELTRRGLVVAS